MSRTIILYGHGINVDDDDTTSPENFQDYIANRIYNRDSRRYRYTQRKSADLIVLSREGSAYGHFEVHGGSEPDDSDRVAYPRVKFVYHVTSSAQYSKPVVLKTMQITNYQFGKQLSETEFAAILAAAGEVSTFPQSCS